jgi:multisubunit Na+/H+ antiporter MnhE subunit
VWADCDSALVHAARRFLIWWVLLTVLWLELVSSSSLGEIVTGIACAAVSAAAALLAHATMDRRFAVDVRWLRWFAIALPASVGDTARLARLLFRPADERAGGRLREVRLPLEGPRRAAGRRAVAVLALGLAPGSYVVAIEGRRLLLHELPGSSPTLTDAISR